MTWKRPLYPKVEKKGFHCKEPCNYNCFAVNIYEPLSKGSKVLSILVFVQKYIIIPLGHNSDPVNKQC